MHCSWDMNSARGAGQKKKQKQNADAGRINEIQMPPMSLYDFDCIRGITLWKSAVCLLFGSFVGWEIERTQNEGFGLMDFIFILWYPKFLVIILSYALKQLIFILTCFTYCCIST